MASKKVSALKFVGTVSVGLLTVRIPGPVPCELSLHTGAFQSPKAARDG